LYCYNYSIYIDNRNQNFILKIDQSIVIKIKIKIDKKRIK